MSWLRGLRHLSLSIYLAVIVRNLSRSGLGVTASVTVDYPVGIVGIGDGMGDMRFACDAYCMVVLASTYSRTRK
ncbi:hypothetical protein B0T16DRAFT_59435 [Cercophora newfieldiana]|uniref:Uncharacterized protein n=1 Tax=Cercophora newfieldiana TaxID=92897 RepID=A0AA40CZI7_9PEZI|nr:hypothetical protein B0T16DRAFT_59435 [Cercophora newfieldiana]